MRSWRNLGRMPGQTGELSSRTLLAVDLACHLATTETSTHRSHWVGLALVEHRFYVGHEGYCGAVEHHSDLGRLLWIEDRVMW